MQVSSQPLPVLLQFLWPQPLVALGPKRGRRHAPFLGKLTDNPEPIKRGAFKGNMAQNITKSTSSDPVAVPRRIRPQAIQISCSRKASPPVTFAFPMDFDGRASSFESKEISRGVMLEATLHADDLRKEEERRRLEAAAELASAYDTTTESTDGIERFGRRKSVSFSDDIHVLHEIVSENVSLVPDEDARDWE